MEMLPPTYIATEHFVILNDSHHLSVIESNDERWMRVIVCTQGEMSLDVDGRGVTLIRGNILFCSYEQKIGHIMLSPDFHFMLFMLSKQLRFEIFPNSAKIWRQFHNFRINNKVSLPDDELNELAYDFSYMSRRLSDTDIPFYKDYVRCLVQYMIYRISAKIGDISEDNDRHDILMSPELLSEAFFNLLNSTYPTPRSVEWYASQLNRTPNYLSTVIKRVSGKRPLDWITEKAVNEVANLLKNSTRSIKEICLQLNFSSPSFFCRYVRQNLGMSPNQYRSTNNFAPEGLPEEIL